MRDVNGQHRKIHAHQNVGTAPPAASVTGQGDHERTRHGRHVRENSEERCTAITRAARELIVEKGLEGLRTRDIADRVGINIATLHYHVPSKEALIEIVAASAKAEFMDQDAAHPRDGMTPPQRLRQELDDFLDTLNNRRDLLMVMSEFMERARRDPAAAALFRIMLHKWQNTVRDILTDGAADGSLRQDIEAEAGATMFIGALIGVAKLSATMPVDFPAVFDALERAFHIPLPPK